ncbi:MAG TPA: SRPBCC family protein [Chloroflexota bacterium]|nr:SRPBCC family protein [Chloroflexota bacterium]
MASHAHTLETTAAPDAVWRIWSAPQTWPEWNPDVQSIELDGPFAAGTTGKMSTKRGGTHDIRLEQVDSGKSFQLETAAIPGARFHFRCEIAPLPSGGSRISQGISMSGPMAWLFGPMMGPKIAQSFAPILQSLKAKAEAAAA